jgi:hypothetical protein
MKCEGMARNWKIPGVHDPLDPEFTILKQRLARRIRYEQLDLRDLDLVKMTEVAERVITDVSRLCHRDCCRSFDMPS